MRTTWLGCLLVALGVGRAGAEPCAEMTRLQREHAGHADLDNSNPAVMNALLNQALAAMDECHKKYRWSKEVETAVEMLMNPVFVVPPEAVYASAPRFAKDAWDFDFYVKVDGEADIFWGTASMFFRGEGDLLAPGLTAAALKRLHAHYQEVYGRRLDELSGHLSELNLTHFQKEFAERRYKKRESESAAKHGAIRAISFGSHRMKPPFNYTVFDVDLGNEADVQLKLSGDATAQTYRVPTKVDVVAKGRRP